MFNKAIKYLNADRPEKALPLFKKLHETKETLCNIGTCYRQLGNDDKAREYYLKSLSPLVPSIDGTFPKTFPISLNNLGLLAYTYEQDEVALELYHKALEANPTYYDALWNMGNAVLRMYCSNKYPDLSTGWDLYEYRFKKSGPTVLKSMKQDLIMWEGEPVKHLVVMVEQGFGDQIMFGRYLSLAAKVCEKITVQCHDRSKVIFDQYDTCLDPSETDATHGIGICSLGKIFNSDIPAGDWLRDKLKRKTPNGTLDIGVTWSGSRHHVNDRYRSSNSKQFSTFAKFGNLYSLNPAEAGKPGFTDLKSGNWGETISELSKLDLVISVDTSIVHLCGALGMPCWVIMPSKNTDFRWGDSSMGFENKWYSSVKVFRNLNGWDSAIKDVCNELEKL